MSIFFKLSSTVTVHKIRPSGPGPAAGGTWAETLACLGHGCCQRGRDVGGWSRGNHMSTESLWRDPGLLSMVLGSAFQSATFWNFLLAWVSFVLGTSDLNLKIQHVCSSALLICTTNRTANFVDHTFFFFFFFHFKLYSR